MMRRLGSTRSIHKASGASKPCARSCARAQEQIFAACCVMVEPPRAAPMLSASWRAAWISCQSIRDDCRTGRPPPPARPPARPAPAGRSACSCARRCGRSAMRQHQGRDGRYDPVERHQQIGQHRTMRTITNRARPSGTTCTIDRSETWIANPGLELQIPGCRSGRIAPGPDPHPDGIAARRPSLPKSTPPNQAYSSIEETRRALPQGGFWAKDVMVSQERRKSSRPRRNPYLRSCVPKGSTSSVPKCSRSAHVELQPWRAAPARALCQHEASRHLQRLLCLRDRAARLAVPAICSKEMI